MTADSVHALQHAVADLPASWENVDMKRILIPAVKALPDLLQDETLWRSKYIDYEPPYLMRLHYQITAPSRDDPSRINAVRVNLHHFFADTLDVTDPYTGLLNPYVVNKDKITDVENPELYHSHPWAAGFFVFEGGYAQEIGMATQRGSAVIPPVTKHQTHDATTKLTHAFAFNDPHIWHRVIPRKAEPVSTMMVSYTPQDWDQPAPPSPLLRDLNDDERAVMFFKFKGLAKGVNPAFLLA